MVDAMLSAGDLLADSSGNLCDISGADALFQMALIRVTVPLGSFIYDRQLGARQGGADLQRIELLLNEALADHPNASVRTLDAVGETLRVQIIINGESRVEEVRYNGNVQ